MQGEISTLFERELDNHLHSAIRSRGSCSVKPFASNLPVTVTIEVIRGYLFGHPQPVYLRNKPRAQNDYISSFNPLHPELVKEGLHPECAGIISPTIPGNCS